MGPKTKGAGLSTPRIAPLKTECGTNMNATAQKTGTSFTTPQH